MQDLLKKHSFSSTLILLRARLFWLKHVGLILSAFVSFKKIRIFQSFFNETTKEKWIFLTSILFCFSLFFLTLWRLLANQALGLIILCVLLYKPWRQILFSRYALQPLFIVMYFLILWSFLSVFYSSAPNYGEALKGVQPYFKLLFLLLFPIALRKNKNAYWIEQALILGVFVNVVLSLVYHSHILGADLYREVLVYPYFYGPTFMVNPLQLIFVEVIALWLLANRFVEKCWKWHDVFIFLILLIYLWGFNIERSGYLLFSALAFLFAWQHASKKALVSILACILIALCSVYFFVTPVKERINEVGHDISLFYKGIPDTSVGLRLAFAADTLVILEEHPLLGGGAGSFPFIYASRFDQRENAVIFNQAHNNYVQAAFELGLVGLTLFLLFLYQLYQAIKKAPLIERNRMQGIFLAFFVMGFLDGGLLLSAVRVSTIVLISLYLQRNRQESLAL